MVRQNDHYYMAIALQLAEKGLFSTDPNPRVGCVLVDPEGEIIAEGWHKQAGQGHAEVNALAIAAERAKGATAYVTLEPCSHFGRTPPCADALINAGVRRVVVAMQDPNPLVSGNGLAKLSAAGIEVTSLVLEAEALALNPGFVKRMSQGLPFVRLKMATSLDGRTAMASGESQWITGPAARADVQRLRARSSAVITGIDSLLLDDSRLNVRAEQPLRGAPADLPIRQPLRVVIDRTLKIPASAALFAEAGDILIASCNDDHRSPLFDNPAVTHWSFDECAGHLPLRALLERLAEERQVNELLVETGAGLAGAFMQQGLVDELVVYMAPMLMGSSARPMFDWPIENMADSRRWQLIDQRILGEDLRLTLRPKQEG